MRIRTVVIALVSTVGMSLAVAAPVSAEPGTTTIVLRQDAPTIVPLPGAVAGETGYSYAYEAVLRGPSGKRAGLLAGVVLTVDGSLDSVMEETRHREVIFDLKDGQLVGHGLSAYPAVKVQLAANRPVVIAIVGGTGDYLGARGQVKTTRNANGTYRHVITLLK